MVYLAKELPKYLKINGYAVTMKGQSNWRELTNTYDAR